MKIPILVSHGGLADGPKHRWLCLLRQDEQVTAGLKRKSSMTSEADFRVYYFELTADDSVLVLADIVW